MIHLPIFYYEPRGACRGFGKTKGSSFDACIFGWYTVLQYSTVSQSSAVGVCDADVPFQLHTRMSNVL